jgi:Mn2+/Fe2+ NRAMP family transporter
MSMVFVAYVITAFFSKPDWGAVLTNTFVPHVDFGFASISTAVALLGATISPYTIPYISCSGQMCYKVCCLQSWSYCLW